MPPYSNGLRRTNVVLGLALRWANSPLVNRRCWRAPDGREKHDKTCNSGDNDNIDANLGTIRPGRQRRVWKAVGSDGTDVAGGVDESNINLTCIQYWTDRVVDQQDGGKSSIESLINRVNQEGGQSIGGGSSGDGRMRQRQLGVLHADPATDMQMLVSNYTVKAVASALRDREDALQEAAVLAADGRLEELQSFLTIFHPKYVVERRRLQKQTKSFMRYDSAGQSIDSSSNNAVLDDPITSLHTDASRQVLRKMLMRMPRTITTAYTKRAAVCIALCLSDGVPSILLEKRASDLRSHPDEVCLPGGMVCDIQDQTIVSTSIREMKEEIGGLGEDNGGSPIEIIGILRLNWGEVQHLTGIAVTPVVCYLGELPDNLQPNPSEVAEIFTIPLADLVDSRLWVHKEGFAPIFVGGPHLIWGLTGYILERLAIELRRLSSV
jgi:nudix motif 8